LQSAAENIYAPRYQKPPAALEYSSRSSLSAAAAFYAARSASNLCSVIVETLNFASQREGMEKYHFCSGFYGLLLIYHAILIQTVEKRRQLDTKANIQTKMMIFALL
jgi:hypothetical protein